MARRPANGKVATDLVGRSDASSVTMPREPTEAMLKAVTGMRDGMHLPEAQLVAIYRTMLAAAKEKT